MTFGRPPSSRGGQTTHNALTSACRVRIESGTLKFGRSTTPLVSLFSRTRESHGSVPGHGELSGTRRPQRGLQHVL